MGWINCGLTDPDDESDESWIDADDATIWEWGESTRRYANSFSYIGIRADGTDEGAIGGVGATDEVLELTDPPGTIVVGGAGTMTGFLNVVNSVSGSVGATDDGFELTCPVFCAVELTCAFTGGVDAIEGGFEPICSFTGGVGATDGGFELTCSFTDVVGTMEDGFESICLFVVGVDAIDDNFELTYASVGSIGARVGFFVAINSEMSGIGATGILDGYRKKILFVQQRKKIIKLRIQF